MAYYKSGQPKKNYVSCPAGDRNADQSGGRNISFCPFICNSFFTKKRQESSHPAGLSEKDLFRLASYTSSSEATLKKKVFPVQRVAEIMASRAAAISFFFFVFFFLVRK